MSFNNVFADINDDYLSDSEYEHTNYDSDINDDFDDGDVDDADEYALDAFLDKYPQFSTTHSWVIPSDGIGSEYDDDDDTLSHYIDSSDDDGYESFSESEFAQEVIRNRVLDNAYPVLDVFDHQIYFHRSLDLIAVSFNKRYFSNNVIPDIIAAAMHPSRLASKLDEYDDFESFFDNL